MFCGLANMQRVMRTAPLIPKTIMQTSASAHALSAGFRGPALHDRLIAAAVHCVLSAVLVLGAILAIVGLWYPEPWFHASGGRSLLVMIVAVDVVMGPALTFVVFDRRKKGLKIDLAVVALLQVAALSYGLYATMLGRPVFQTFVVDRFEVVSAAEVDPTELALAPPTMRQLGWGRPTVAAALRPTDPAVREQLAFAPASGIDLRHLLRYYVPYEEQRDAVLKAARPLAALSEFNSQDLIDVRLKDVKADPATLRWLPVSAPREDLVALIDARTAELRAVVRLSPWKP